MAHPSQMPRTRRAVAGIVLSIGWVVVLGGVDTGATEFRRPDEVPPSWVQFSKLVKYRFEEWLRADDPIADRLRVYIKVHAGRWDGPPQMMTVRAWINRDGSVAKVAFPNFNDAGATRDLNLLLSRGEIGESPPPDMLQPINLRFSLDLSSKTTAP
jgi:hypothetical protein